jgi:hypothetical protein
VRIPIAALIADVLMLLILLRASVVAGYLLLALVLSPAAKLGITAFGSATTSSARLCLGLEGGTDPYPMRSLLRSRESRGRS